MKRLNAILLSIAFIIVPMLQSCTRIETEVPSPEDLITVIGRVTSFANQDVTSKGAKLGDEKKISNMTMFVISGAGDVVNTPECLSGSSEYVFKVDRQQYQGINQSDMAAASIYIFANIPNSMKATLTAVRSLGELLALDIPVSGVDEPGEGFPMIGHLDIDLSTNSAESGEKQIPLKALYAKVVFNITIDPIQQNPEVTQRFQMKTWTVHNVPGAVRVAVPADSTETANVGNMQSGEFTSSRYSGSNPVSTSQTLSFSFYVPEHRINPLYVPEHRVNTVNPAGSVTYPFDDTPENAEYRQHFKPALVGHGTANAKNATYVVINGDYFDHNGTRREVTYTIYLGRDNYKDFYINRDCQYNNYITIRGLSNNTSVRDKESVSYDLRVDVEQAEFKFELERETLLDSHWEIRPLRITLDADEHPNSKVVISIENPSTSNWLRMEMPQNPTGAEYCEVGSSNIAYGKRKYFTTNLVTNTLSGGTSFTINATPGQPEHTIWMYIDEFVNKTAGNITRNASVTIAD